MRVDRSTKILLVVTALLILAGGALIWQGLRAFEKTQNVAGTSGQEITVTEVVDGDTIEVALERGVKVRYIGVDTPETVDPRRPAGCFGREAARENRRLVEGKKVILVKDVSETDKFGRLLRYVYLRLPDGNILFVNDYLIRQGFAKAVTFPPNVKYTGQFLQAEREAREGRRGLWGKC